ncbi:dihydrofolate reductase family protein [Ferrovibrio sp.]|uniref:dihydrofolate reductase family protein n=1 Tax=Ferrovibrio sp. TaxID=1917215 RepID=UPI0035AFA75D
MKEYPMRKLISAFKVSLDLKFQGPGDYADWVPAWSEDYDLGDSIDACVLGGAMYRGYEGYWSAMRTNPAAPSPMTGTVATADELKWAERIPDLPHYVLTRTMTESQWPNTRFLNDIDRITELKQQAGKNIYLMGGGAMFRRLMAEGLVDELRLIVYPIAAGGTNDLFTHDASRQPFRLLNAKRLDDGLMRLDYAVAR